MDLWPKRSGAAAYCLAFVAALLLGLVTSFLYERTSQAGRVGRGIAWGGETISGYDKGALDALLLSRGKEARSTQIELSVGKARKQFLAGNLGIALKTARVPEGALSLGRRGSLVRQFGFFCARLFSTHEIPLALSLDENKLKRAVESWTRPLLQEPELPSLSFDKKLVIAWGRGGTVVEYPPLGVALQKLAQARSQAAGTGAAAHRLVVPTTVRPPPVARETVDRVASQARALLGEPVTVLAPEGGGSATLTPQVLGAALSSEVDAGKGTLELRLSAQLLREALKSLLSECEHPPLDADFEFPSGGAPLITESRSGRVLDEPALVSGLLALKSGGGRRITLPLEDKEPRLTTQEATGLGVKGLVTSFTTRHSCCEARVQNIHHAAEQLDGHVLRPGEKFSLNEFLGPRTAASGYHKAPTIVRGEMEDVYGGGISQLATTLFNAVLRGGYEIVQRQPHSVYFPRYPEGHEATVSYPEPDLIFRNDTAAGMVIKTNAAPTFISVLVFGDNGGRITTVEKGRRYNIVEPPKEYEPDEGLAPEKTKRLRAGQLGWTVLVSRKVKYPDGTEKSEKREVVYNPRPELLRVHPCMIPEGDERHTGEECPEREIQEEEEELSDDAYYETQ